MEYIDIFHFPPWSSIGTSILQTTVLFCLILAGLRLVGRRVFAQKGPQDLITIVLVAEACNIGLADENAGFWGTVASVMTIFILGYLTEKITPLRHILNEKPIILYQDGRLNQDLMKCHMIGEEDLDETAREQGFASYKNFNEIILESGGQISGVYQNRS